MKKLLSTNYGSTTINICMFLLRLSSGSLMIVKHGLPKLMNFSERQNNFYNFMGLSPKFSLILAIFAELFCSLFLVLGLFTRFTVIPLIITMLVIIFGVDAGKPFVESELAITFLTIFVVLLLCGPGKISVDNMVN